MTGQEDILATCAAITERLDEIGDKVPLITVLPVYSLLPSELQAKIFDKAEGGARKVPVSARMHCDAARGTDACASATYLVQPLHTSRSSVAAPKPLCLHSPPLAIRSAAN
eukprot:6179143-Pleurochrysis_carterae.AAC.2